MAYYRDSLKDEKFYKLYDFLQCNELSPKETIILSYLIDVEAVAIHDTEFDDFFMCSIKKYMCPALKMNYKSIKDAIGSLEEKGFIDTRKDGTLQIRLNTFKLESLRKQKYDEGATIDLKKQAFDEIKNTLVTLDCNQIAELLKTVRDLNNPKVDTSVRILNTPNVNTIEELPF